MLDRIEAEGRMEEADVLALRRQVYGAGDGKVSKADIADITALLEAADEGCPDWRWFLRDAFRDHFLRQSAPVDYFSDEGAARLLDITRPRNRPNRLRTHVLIHLLNSCRAAPEELAERAMTLLEADVLEDGRICEADVTEIRLLLHAQGSYAGLGICRREADFLFTLNDYSRGGENSREWTDLFSKAIANHLMHARGYEAPPREEALRREGWLADTNVNVGGFMGRMVTGLFEGFGRRDRDYWKLRNDALDRQIEVAARVTEDEAEWLAARIGRDGEFCEAERAMIGYVRGLCEFDLPEVLAPYLKAA